MNNCMIAAALAVASGMASAGPAFNVIAGVSDRFEASGTGTLLGQIEAFSSEGGIADFYGLADFEFAGSPDAVLSRDPFMVDKSFDGEPHSVLVSQAINLFFVETATDGLGFFAVFHDGLGPEQKRTPNSLDGSLYYGDASSEIVVNDDVSELAGGISASKVEDGMFSLNFQWNADKTDGFATTFDGEIGSFIDFADLVVATTIDGSPDSVLTSIAVHGANLGSPLVIGLDESGALLGDGSAFRLQATSSVIPAPGTALLGAAGLGLIGRRRRR